MPATLPPPADLADALNKELSLELRDVAFGLCVLYMLFTVAHPLLVGGAAGVILAASSSVTALLFLGIALAFRKATPPPRLAHPIAVGYVVAVLANAALHLFLTRDAKQSSNFILVLIAAGAFFLSMRWFLLAVAIVVATWIGVAGYVGLGAATVHWTFAIGTAIGISAFVCKARISMLGSSLLSAARVRELNIGLEERVRERTRELHDEIESRKNAEHVARESEKLAAAGRIAATIAHEINNPLESVSNLVYLIRTNAFDPARVVQFAEIAEKEVVRMTHIAKQTLSFYREPGAPSGFDLAAALREVLDLYAPKIERKQLHVRSECPESLNIVGYEGEIKQVVSNLLINAIDASQIEGTVRIRLRQWRHSQCADGARLTIADRGSGIAEDLKERIFQPFFSTKAQSGTGLGLWVALGIVTRHGGRLRLRSSTDGTGRGSCFVLWLPVEIPRETQHRRRFEESHL